MFIKGQSGNPAGRKKGDVTRVAKLRALIDPHAPALIQTAITAAKAGDMVAMRLVLARVCPELKADSEPVQLDIDFTGSPVDQSKEILKAATEGRLSVDDAMQLLQGIQTQCRIIEVTELEERLKRLEEGLTQ